MISYLINHYNRPYFLQFSIDCLRKFGGQDWQIVVADSGSDKRIQKKIENMNIDALYLSKCDDYSGALEMGKKLCTQEFFAYAEDDFIYMAQPLVPDQVESNFLPSIYLQHSTPRWVYEHSISLLKNNADIKLISLVAHRKIKKRIARRTVLRFPVVETVELNGSKIDFVPLHYSSNAPYLMRMEDAKRIIMPSGIPNSMHMETMWRYEYQKIFRQLPTETDYPFYQEFALSGRMTTTRCHTHLGTILPLTSGSRFNERTYRSALLSKYKHLKHPPHLVPQLNELWLTNDFYINFDEVLECGTKQALKRAFRRIE